MAGACGGPASQLAGYRRGWITAVRLTD